MLRQCNMWSCLSRRVFINHSALMSWRMERRHLDPNPVTLTLQDSHGDAWPLTLSADCLRFIGPYRRVEGFSVDAMLLFEGLRKAG